MRIIKRLNKYILYYCMNPKNLIIIGIWAFLIVLVAGFFIFQIEMEFFGYLIFLVLGFIFSIIVTYLPEK